MACGIGVCMTCVLPVVGERRDHQDGPLLRGRAGVPRRRGALGRRRARSRSTPSARRAGSRGQAAAATGGTAGGRSRREAGAAVPAGRGGGMAADLRTRLGHVELPNPILTASGCAGRGPRARPVHRRRQDRRDRHQVGDARARGRAGRRRGWPRRRAGCSTRSACRARASTRSCSATCRGCCRAGARAVVSIAGGTRRRVRRAGRPAVRRGRRDRDRGQHLLPERRGPRARCSPATPRRRPR